MLARESTQRRRTRTSLYTAVKLISNESEKISKILTRLNYYYNKMSTINWGADELWTSLESDSVHVDKNYHVNNNESC